MHLNRRGKGLVSKQLAFEVWKLTTIEATAPISLGWKVEHEQMVSSKVVDNETVTVGNDNPMDALKIEVDKQAVKDQQEIVISVNSANSLNIGTVTNDINAVIPTKSKRLRRAPITKTDDFLW
jgi:hypothetical protein